MRQMLTRVCAFVLVAALAVFGVAMPAQATLELVQPDPAVPATFVGRGGVSTDGLGTVSGTPENLQAQVPAGSEVEQAYLYGTYIQGTNEPSEIQRTVTFEGDPVVMELLGPDPATTMATARADVTDVVAAKVGSGGGVTSFSVLEAPGITGVLDGTALVVIYSNPSLPTSTIAVLDGESTTAGDEFSFGFATPLEPDRPGFTATLALGIGYSAQNQGGGPPHDCGGGQFSEVDVNGERLTSCAGHTDDGALADGALITVGGVGDSTDNPADPNATSGGTDDELYNLVPFLSEGDAEITIATRNESSNDNVFLAVLQVSQAAGEEVEPPEAVDDTASTSRGTPVDIDVIANDRDPDDVIDPSTLTIVTEPSDGTAEVVTGFVRYTPDAGFVGTDTFDYEICGVDRTACTQATVTVTVTADAAPARPVVVQPRFTG